MSWRPSSTVGSAHTDYEGWSSRSPSRLPLHCAVSRSGGNGLQTAGRNFCGTFAEQRERPERNTRFQEYVAQVLVAAPDGVDRITCGSSAAGFVKRLAEEYDIDREAELRVLWEKAWKGKTESRHQAFDLDDPLNEALNHLTGKLAEAALIRLWKYEPRAGEGLPHAGSPVLRRNRRSIRKDSWVA